VSRRLEGWRFLEFEGLPERAGPLLMNVFDVARMKVQSFGIATGVASRMHDVIYCSIAHTTESSQSEAFACKAEVTAYTFRLLDEQAVLTSL
jgi:hypothetical protein